MYKHHHIHSYKPLLPHYEYGRQWVHGVCITGVRFHSEAMPWISQTMMILFLSPRTCLKRLIFCPATLSSAILIPSRFCFALILSLLVWMLSVAANSHIRIVHSTAHLLSLFNVVSALLYPCYLLLCPVLRSLFLLSIVFLPTLCILCVGSTVSVDITIRKLIILKTFFVLT